MELKQFSTGETGLEKDMRTARKVDGGHGIGLSQIVVSAGLLEKEFGLTEAPPKGVNMTYCGVPVRVEKRWTGVCYKLIWGDKK